MEHDAMEHDAMECDVMACDVMEYSWRARHTSTLGCHDNDPPAAYMATPEEGV